MGDENVILVVDPDREFAESIGTLLRANGFAVEVMNDGLKALEYCREQLPVMMVVEGLIPKLNGIDLSKQVRELPDGADVPILLVSAVYSGPKFRPQIREAKINEVISKPVDPEVFLKKVRALSRVDEELVPVRATPGKVFSPTGFLSDTPFIRIVFHLYSLKETGTLRLENATTKKLITFESGEPKFVVSNLEQECLGQILVRKGRLSPEELAKSLEAMGQLKKRQGESLIQLGMIEPYELDEALKLQAREKFCEIFSWREGKYLFVPGKVFRKELTPVDLSVAQLCLRGVKEYYTLVQIEAAMNALISSSPKVINQPFRFEDYKLATWDVKIARQIQLGKSLSDVLAMKIGRDIDAYHLFFTLMMLGTVEMGAPTKKQSEGTRTPTAFTPVAPSMPDASPFELLGVSEQSGDADIRKAYEEKIASLGDAPPWDGRPTAYRRAYEMISSFQGRRDFLIRTYQDQGKLPAQAQEVFKPQELLAIGKQFLEKKEYTRAIKAFEDTMRLFKETGLAYAYYGFAQIQAAQVAGQVDRDDFEKWKRVVIRGTQVSPGEAEAHYLMGRIFSWEQDFEKAVIAFKRALAENKKLYAAETELRLAEKRFQKKDTSAVPFIKWKE